jgi:hypothetical protein
MSAGDPFPHFSAPCKRSFAFLIERYGFSGPEEEQIGRERYIRYSKDHKFVSIAYEPHGPPVIEFFSPSLEIKNRSFPKRPSQPFQMRMPKRHQEWTEQEIEQFLRFWAVQIEENDSSFLT